MLLLSWGVRGGVLLAGLLSCEIVLHLNASFTLVCLKRLVIFLICEEVYVKVAHFLSVPVVVGVLCWVILHCILGFCLINRFTGRLLCAICSMFFHSSCCSSLRGRVSILLMNWWTASLCSSRWWRES